MNVLNILDVSALVYTGSASEFYRERSNYGFYVGGIHYLMKQVAVSFAIMDSVLLCFDSPSFRKELMAGYKAGRVFKPGVYTQIPLFVFWGSQCRLKSGISDAKIFLEQHGSNSQNGCTECPQGGLFYLIYTGLRPGELTALALDDIDFSRGFIKVTKTLIYQKLEGDEKIQIHVGSPKTDSSIRDVPISNDLLLCLTAQIKQSKNVKQRRGTDNQYLFVNPYGRPISPKCYSEAILRIVREINSQRAADEEIPQFHAHTFWHTFATRCLENGISPKTLQSYLGHATLNTTIDKYVHILPEFKKQEMDRVQLGLY